MCAPGSTAAVERVFSVAGYILSPKRMSLSDENFENQLFSNLNLSVFQVWSNKLKLSLNNSSVINSGDWDWDWGDLTLLGLGLGLG